MRNKLIGLFALALIAMPAAAETLHAKISWQYQDLPANMRIFEVRAGEKPTLWTTQSSKEINKIPIAKEIVDGVLHLEKGSNKRFVLVFSNPGDTPLYFFATPHQVEPAEYSLGFKFKCLCIDHAYTVQPREFWYRVVELRTSRYMVGDKIAISHTLVGINKERMADFAVQNLSGE